MFAIFMLVALLPAPVASLALGANDTTGHAGCCFNCDAKTGDPLFREPAGCLAKKPCGSCAHIDTDVDKCNVHSLLGAQVQSISTAPQVIKDYMAGKAHVTGDELKRLAEKIVAGHKKDEAAHKERVERQQAEDRLRAEEEKRREAEDKPKVAARALHRKLGETNDVAMRLQKRTQTVAGLAAERDFLGRAEKDATGAEEAFLNEEPPTAESVGVLSNVKQHERKLLEALLQSQDPGCQKKLKDARERYTWEAGKSSEEPGTLKDQHTAWLYAESEKASSQGEQAGSQQLQEVRTAVKAGRALLEKARAEEFEARKAKDKGKAEKATSEMLKLLEQAAEKFSEEERLLNLAAGGMPELSKAAVMASQLQMRTIILMLRSMPQDKWPTVLRRLPQELPGGLSHASERLLATARAVMDLKQDRLSEKNVDALEMLAARVHVLERDAGRLKDSLEAEAAEQSEEVSALLGAAAVLAVEYSSFVSHAGTALGQCVGYDEDDDASVLGFKLGAAYKCQEQAEGPLRQAEDVAKKVEENTNKAWTKSQEALDELEGKGSGGKRRRTMARGVRRVLSAVRRAAARFST